MSSYFLVADEVQALKAEAAGDARLSRIVDYSESITAHVLDAAPPGCNDWLTVDIARAALVRVCDRASDESCEERRLLIAAAVRLFLIAVREASESATIQSERSAPL